jgi:hypothetical protein
MLNCSSQEAMAIITQIVAQRNWIGINTYPNQLDIRARVERGAFKKEQIAKELGLDEDKVDIDERNTRYTFLVLSQDIGQNYYTFLVLSTHICHGSIRLQDTNNEFLDAGVHSSSNE